MQVHDKSRENILSSFVIVMFLVLVLGMVSVFKLVELSGLTQKFYNHPFSVTTSAYKIQQHLVSMHRYMKDVVLSQNEEELLLAVQKVNNDEKSILREFEIITDRYLGDKTEIKKTYDLFIAWRPIRKDVIGLMKQNRQKEAIKMNQTRAYDHANEVIKSANVLIDYAHNKANVFVEDAKKTKKLSIYLIVTIIIVILTLIVGLAVVLLKKIKKAQDLKFKQEKELLQHSRLVQMGEMISMIAHQWRQPLGAIASTSIDIKLKSKLEHYDLAKKEDAREYEAYVNSGIEKIENFVKNLTTTIDDFRNFYKPNKKRVTTRMEDVVLKSLSIIKASLESDNIRIIQEYNSKEEIELYDSEMMQVILNILKNAQDNIKERQIKEPFIKITTNDRSISICDNGGGIPEDIIEKIFDPYFTTKGERNGTGLGLYMSKTIVEEHHNGKLNVQNRDGGVCFTIECQTPPAKEFI